MALLAAARRSSRHARRGMATVPAWDKLGFDFTETRSMIKYNWKDGAWDAGTITTDLNVTIHGLSNVLHYGQGIFEGLKAFHCKDGQVRVFNSGANAARLASGCRRLAMPEVSPEMFDEGLDRLLADNMDFVPPYGSGGSMYIRPFLFGHGAKLGLGPAPEYSLCMIASPVGAYYKGGLTAIDGVVVEGYDRAAPAGVGNIKAAGNYAPDVLPSSQQKALGFPICLYLDAKTNEHVEEFSTSNFLGVTKDGTLVTPYSPSILPSCTKRVILTLAQDMGIKVEERAVPYSEVADLAEVAACGTAVVLTPIKSLTRAGEKLTFDGFPTISRLYEAVTAIQVGEAPDEHGYTRAVGLRPHEAC